MRVVARLGEATTQLVTDRGHELVQTSPVACAVSEE